MPNPRLVLIPLLVLFALPAVAALEAEQGLDTTGHVWLVRALP